MGARWRGYSYGECEHYPHGPSGAACRPVVQLSRGETLTPGPAQLLSTGICPLLAPSLSIPARVFAGFQCWFFPASHLQSGRSFHGGTLFQTLPWRCLALFKRRARIGLCRVSGGSVRGGGWLVGGLVVGYECFWYGADEFVCMGDGVMGGTMRHYGCSTHERESAAPVAHIVRIVRIASPRSGVQRE